MLFFLYGGRKRIPSSVCSSQILLWTALKNNEFKTL
jgi:hypothetical protein